MSRSRGKDEAGSWEDALIMMPGEEIWSGLFGWEKVVTFILSKSSMVTTMWRHSFTKEEKLLIH